MNARVVTFIFSTIGLIQPLVAAAPLKANNDGLSQMNAVLVSLQTKEKDELAEVLAPDEAVIPRGPADILKDYENQMNRFPTGSPSNLAKSCRPLTAEN